MTRATLLDAVCAMRQPWDVIVIGGGATGAGVAWDAAGRGLSTLLLEGGDFGCGTSSRSTKLIHGGIRYLAQGQLGLVFEALREREHLLVQAPALVTRLAFTIPTTGWVEHLKYRFGLALYARLARSADAMAPRDDPAAVRASLGAPGARLLRYADARFDDTRLLLAVLARAADHGAHVVNHAPVRALLKNAAGRVRGVVCEDMLTGAVHEFAGRIIINAAGPGARGIAALDDPRRVPSLTLSRGSHVVVERAFWPHPQGLLMPRTPDGRVMFALPWHDRVLLGTTDVPTTPDAPLRATAAEIDEILAVASCYLARAPRADDITACFAGVRPLAGTAAHGTARASREYQLTIADSGLVSLYGGKWTTFRRMAVAGLDAALGHHGIAAQASRTTADRLDDGASLLPPVLRVPAAAGGPDASLEATLARAIGGQLACRVEDVLGRRLRTLFVDVAQARALAPTVAAALARAHGRDATWVERELAHFEQIAADYLPPRDDTEAPRAAA